MAMEKSKETAPDISAFLASAAHDMKNSIGVLIDFLENNISKLEPDARQKAAPMLYEAKRVNANFVQMLAIYKIGNQFYPFDATENSISDLVQEIVAQNKAMLDYSGIDLEVDFDKELTWYFDYDLIYGTISHALNNAAHHSKDKLLLSVQEDDGELVVRVEDNGSGYTSSILEASNTACKEINFVSGSTGLGLYFSSMVARLHKNRGKTGGVSLENGGKFGGGCFVLRLP